MDIKTAVPSAESADDDVKLLHKMGYAQELSRRMGAFSNFAVSFSLICILSGGITSFQMGLSAAGGASIGLGWPLGSLFAMVVAAAMAQIASSYPTAGGLYHWSSILGGKTWGWLTAWLNLLGLVFVVAAINYGTYDPFFRTLIAPMFGVNPDSLGWWQQTLFLTVITASQAFLNHRGIRITSKITDLSGYLIFVVTIMLVVSLLVYSPVKIDLSRLYTFTNFTGVDGGAWPKQTIAMAFLSGLLLTAYTITGFDASAHTSEETHEAARNVPRGIVGSVFWSTTFGYVMVCAFVLVMPDLGAAVKQGTGFFQAILAPIPGPLRILIELLMFFINYVCGLAAVTSTSRMMFAFARDGGLPASKWLRKVNVAHRGPHTGRGDLDVGRAGDRRHVVWRCFHGAERGQCGVPVHLLRNADCSRYLCGRAHVEGKGAFPVGHAVQTVRGRGGVRCACARLCRHAAAESESGLRDRRFARCSARDLVRRWRAQEFCGAADR
jgi:amino acid transporter